MWIKTPPAGRTFITYLFIQAMAPFSSDISIFLPVTKVVTIQLIKSNFK